MIRIRSLKNFEDIYDVPPTALVQAIDGRRFLDTGEIVRVGEPAPLSDMKAFDVIEVETGFEDEAGQKSIMLVAPMRLSGYQDTLMSMILR